MRLFVGLGNPGASYARNRHNIGFMAVDAIADAHGFGPWREKFQGFLSEGRLGGDKVLLLKPDTFMNLSGRSVVEAARFYKIAPEEVVVFHDELDLAPGKVRVKEGGGHAGHNGLRSVHQYLGPDYVRVRMGIGHPGEKHLVSNYVLHDFAKADEEWLTPLIDAVAGAAGRLAEGDWPGFQNAVALKLNPPRKSSAGAPSPARKDAEARQRSAKAIEAAPQGPLAQLLAKFGKR